MFLQHSLHGAASEKHSELIYGRFWHSSLHPCNITALQAVLAPSRLLKVLVVTYKALHGIESEYLLGHLCPILFACHVRSSRKGMLWVSY